MYKPTVTGPLGTSLPWHFPCRNEKRQTMSGFFYGRRRTEVAKERQGLVGGGGGLEKLWRQEDSIHFVSKNNKLYLHDYNKLLQYCKSYLKLIIDSF